MDRQFPFANGLGNPIIGNVETVMEFRTGGVFLLKNRVGFEGYVHIILQHYIATAKYNPAIRKKQCRAINKAAVAIANQLNLCYKVRNEYKRKQVDQGSAKVIKQ
jgi:hypothetical protein